MRTVGGKKLNMKPPFGLCGCDSHLTHRVCGQNRMFRWECCAAAIWWHCAWWARRPPAPASCWPRPGSHHHHCGGHRPATKRLQEAAPQPGLAAARGGHTPPGTPGWVLSISNLAEGVRSAGLNVGNLLQETPARVCVRRASLLLGAPPGPDEQCGAGGSKGAQDWTKAGRHLQQTVPPCFPGGHYEARVAE